MARPNLYFQVETNTTFVAHLSSPRHVLIHKGATMYMELEYTQGRVVARYLTDVYNAAIEDLDSAMVHHFGKLFFPSTTGA